MVLAILTFWLFAQSMVNIIPSMQKDFRATPSILSIATSLTSLFCGLFIVVGGGFADKLGRKKVTYIGLIISIIASIALIVTSNATVLMVSRALQGFSAALIMPATLSLIRTNFEDAERQRALSYWSFGSWGGGGITTFVGGAIATYLGWQWIFIFSTVIAFIAMYLLKDIEEAKDYKTAKKHFDYIGFVIFLVTLLMINIVITQGSTLGWTSVPVVSMIAASIILTIVFYFYERGKSYQFIDFKLFKSKEYTGSVVTNFLQNGIAGTIVVANTYMQVARGFSSFQTGLLTIGNVVALLLMIRVGEKMLQKQGAKRPMVQGIIIAALGMSCGALTFLPDLAYIIIVFIGFLIAGIGIGMYATPSIDTSLVTVQKGKVGKGSGIYKMASSLGYSFGIAISTAVYGAVENITHSQTIAGMSGMLTPMVLGILSLITMYVTMYDKLQIYKKLTI
jgi:DHA2 family multidrug resistance protein-like MFS transporter